MPPALASSFEITPSSGGRSYWCMSTSASNFCEVTFTPPGAACTVMPSQPVISPPAALAA